MIFLFDTDKCTCVNCVASQIDCTHTQNVECMQKLEVTCLKSNKLSWSVQSRLHPTNPGFQDVAVTVSCCSGCCQSLSNNMGETTTVLLMYFLSFVIAVVKSDILKCEQAKKYTKDYTDYQVISVTSNLTRSFTEFLSKSKSFIS